MGHCSMVGLPSLHSKHDWAVGLVTDILWTKMWLLTQLFGVNQGRGGQLQLCV